MINKIKDFYEKSKLLEIEAIEKEKITSRVIEYTNNFLADIENMKAFHIENKELDQKFIDELFSSQTSIHEIIDDFETVLDKSGINPASPNYFGYIPGGGLYPAALADFVSAVTNRYSTFYLASPAAVKMENMLIRWLTRQIGYSDESGGVHTSGGSMANIIAVNAARDSVPLQAKQFAQSVVYLSEHTHHSIQKALKVSGMGEALIRKIPVDKHFRMQANLLRDAISEDKKNALIPWLVVASAGTTDVGSVDPISQLADISSQNNLWLHVDAAYGGFFIFTDKGSHLLAHLNRANSIALDPHKSLFLPYGSGICLVKNRKHLLQTYHSQANYLQDESSSSQEISPSDMSMELTRNFRGLRLWLPLKIFGIAPFKAALEEKLLLAQYFHDEILLIPNVEVACEPDLSIVAFRYCPQGQCSNVFNKKLLKEIQRDGRIFLSSTILNDKVFLRMACLSFRSHLDNINLALRLIKELISVCLH